MGLRSFIKSTIKGALGLKERPERSDPKRPKTRTTRPPGAPQAEQGGHDHGHSHDHGDDEAETIDMANIECGGQELYERVSAGEGICIVDVRTPGEVAGGVIPGALHIPLGELERRWGELRDEDEVVLYCAAGMRSFNAAMLLRQKGILNATSLAGGLPAWSSAGGAIGPLS